MTGADPEVDRLTGTRLAYLRETLDEPTIGYDLPLTRLRGGYETSIYRFSLCGVAGALGRPLVLRLYPARFCPEQALWESQAPTSPRRATARRIRNQRSTAPV